MSASPLAVDTSYTTAVVGLAGSLIGGFIAGAVSLLVARQAREAAERAWIRDNRREIYDRFLTSAQRLLIACQTRQYGRPGGGADSGLMAEEAENDGSEASVGSAHTKFFEVYGVVQTIANTALVAAARVYGYRLLALEAITVPASVTGPDDFDHVSVIGPENFERVTQLIRDARHGTVDAMRAELGLKGTIWPTADYNPFVGTDLEQKYATAPKQDQRGPAA